MKGLGLIPGSFILYNVLIATCFAKHILRKIIIRQKSNASWNCEFLSIQDYFCAMKSMGIWYMMLVCKTPPR